MGRAHSHAHGLFVAAHSPLHRLRPECKVAAVVLFVLAVVATPREAFWAYGCFTAVLAGLARLGQVPPGFIVRRLAVEAPFVAFALLLPVVGQGPRVEVGFLSLSVAGLWAAWNILVKATLGVAASILLAATTEVPELLHGLERLHLPRAFTAIAGFMVRYADVIAGEMRRMKVARVSRAFDPRWIWQARAVAASAGTLFVRSYERGERVYLAMLSRGFDGTLPRLADDAAPPGQWLVSLSLPALGATISGLAWLSR